MLLKVVKDCSDVSNLLWGLIEVSIRLVPQTSTRTSPHTGFWMKSWTSHALLEVLGILIIILYITVIYKV